MKKFFCAMLLWVIMTAFSAAFCVAGDEDAIRQAVMKSYPNLKVGEIHTTAIPGLYELEIGADILYFFPEKESGRLRRDMDKGGEEPHRGAQRRAGCKETRGYPPGQGHQDRERR